MTTATAEIARLRAENAELQERIDATDADLLNWIEHQDLEELSMGIVIDAAHDGEYYVNGDDNVTYYGKTLREALKKALRAKGGKAVSALDARQHSTIAARGGPNVG